MTDKEKIRAYIESQIALLEKNDTGNPVFGVSAGVVMAELKHLLSFIDNLQEEPVSEGGTLVLPFFFSFYYQQLSNKPLI